MAHDVFISYSHADAAVTNAVCHMLEQNGIRCWYAPRDIRAGANFDTALVQAIKDTRVFLLVFSKMSGQSHYVHQEVRTAFEAGKVVIPFRIADTVPEGGMELLLKGVHWLDAIDPPLEAHLERLLENIHLALGMQTDVPKPVDLPNGMEDTFKSKRIGGTGGGTHKTAAKRSSKTLRRVIASACALCAIFALAYFTGAIDSVLAAIGWQKTAVTLGGNVDRSEPEKGNQDQSAAVTNVPQQKQDNDNVLAFQPIGEAVISTVDGYQVTCPANCILFRGYYDMIAGLADTPDYGSYHTNIVYFADMKSLSVSPKTSEDEYGAKHTEYVVQASVKDGREVKYTYTAGEFLFTEGAGRITFDISKVKDVKFDFAKENATELKLGKVTPVSGIPYYVPLDLLFVNIYHLDMGVGSTWYDGVPFGGTAVPFHQMQSLEIVESTDNRFNGWGVKAKYRIVMPEGSVMEGEIDEDSYDFVGTNRFGSFRCSVLNELKSIVVPK